LSDSGEAAEVHDVCLVGLLPQQRLSEFDCDGAVAGEVVRHGHAGVDEDTGMDGEVLHDAEFKDFAGRDAVVEETQVAECEVVGGQALGASGVEGEDNFVDRDGEGVGWWFGDGL